MGYPNIIQQVNSKLPLSGGTMTGNLAISSMYCNKMSSSTTWGVGTTWNDAPSISLYGPNETSSSIPNCFTIRAGANKYSLTGKPDGTLTWGGNNVITSAGGTINGNLTLGNASSSYGIQRPDNSGELGLRGGVGNSGGAYLYLHGKDMGGAESDGRFDMGAVNSSKTYMLTGKPDGTLTWGGNLIRTANNMLPNMASAISLAKETNVTITSYGWVLFRNTVYQTGANGYYNNVIVWKVLGTTNAFEDWNHIMIPVGPGDIVKLIVSKGTAEMLFFANKT